MEHLGQFISNHWYLWLALIAILVMILINESILQKKKAKELSAQAAVDLMNNNEAIIVDIREAEAYKAGHIIDSINAKASDFELPKMDKYKNKTLILVCARGLQSPSIAAKLKIQGFQPLVLAGGIASWQQADLPLVKGSK